MTSCGGTTPPPQAAGRYWATVDMFGKFTTPGSYTAQPAVFPTSEPLETLNLIWTPEDHPLGLLQSATGSEGAGVNAATAFRVTVLVLDHSPKMLPIL